MYLFTLGLYLIANIGLATQSSFVGLLLLRMLQSAGISGTNPSSTSRSKGITALIRGFRIDGMS